MGIGGVGLGPTLCSYAVAEGECAQNNIAVLEDPLFEGPNAAALVAGAVACYQWCEWEVN